MDDQIDIETTLAEALKLTADPPEAWIEAAALIPSTLGDLSQIERLAADPEFRAQFARDPAAALSAAGLQPSGPVLAAVRARLDA